MTITEQKVQLSSDTFHLAVADALDGFTKWRLANLDVDLTEARVLDIGPGHGSIAHWLTTQIGPRGRVTALTPEPDLIPPHPKVDNVGHDLASPHALPSQVSWPFDLIHVRLTLWQLPHRRQLLHQLADRLAPGGMLLVQEWTIPARGVIVQAPDPGSRELYERFQAALVRAMAAAEVGYSWASGLHVSFLEEGLVEARTMRYREHWRHGHPGVRLVAELAEQLTPQLEKVGFTQPQLGRLRQLLIDPWLIVAGYPLHSVSGRRPA